MTSSVADGAKFDELEWRIRTILPEQYQDSYEDVQPVSMGSAKLRYGRDGKVAWGEIWETFCHLAMAGGPPHKGMLLRPGTPAEVEAQPDRYHQVTDEICRGIALTTELAPVPSLTAGWVQVDCRNRGTAEWLVRAIVMENISARVQGTVLYLPAGPAYRVEKEIKNVITAVSKTCHYWFDHMIAREQTVIEQLFAKMQTESPLVQPAVSSSGLRGETEQQLCNSMSERIRQVTGLQPSNHKYAEWLGVECPDVRSAIWMMRGLVVSNVLSRREGTALFVPVDPADNAASEFVVQALGTVYRFAVSRGVV